MAEPKARPKWSECVGCAAYDSCGYIQTHKDLQDQVPEGVSTTPKLCCPIAGQRWANYLSGTRSQRGRREETRHRVIH